VDHSLQTPSMSHHQPAAELIANALAKIKKLAGNKKHADLAQQCQTLIDSIHEVGCWPVAGGHALTVSCSCASSE
jgi:hypothetical protein